MRGSPDYTSVNRKALPPKDDDMMPIWQKSDKGVYTQRWQRRKEFDDHILDIVDQDRAEITERVTSAVARIDGQQAAITANQTALAAANQTLTTQQATLTAQQKALQDMDVKLAAQQAAMQTLLDELAKRKQVVPLPDVIIPASELITLLAGERAFANLACTGLRTTDTVIVTPKTISVGYGIRGWSIPANDRITIRLQCPVLTVGGTAQVFAITAFR